MKRMLPLLLVASLIANASAAEYSAQVPHSRVHKVRLHPQFFGLDGREYRHPRLPTELTYFFRMKPGYLYATSDRSSFQLEVVRGDRNSFLVKPDYWLPRFDDLARPLNTKAAREGLDIDPAQTRVGVTHTAVRDMITGNDLGAFATLRSSSNDVWLVYVDRACRISGTLSLEDRSLTYDVTLPGRGVHQLVETSAADSGQKRVIAVKGTGDLEMVIAY